MFCYTPGLPPRGTLDFVLKYQDGLGEVVGDSLIVQGYPLVVNLNGNDVPDIFFLPGFGRRGKLVTLRPRFDRVRFCARIHFGSNCPPTDH